MGESFFKDLFPNIYCLALDSQTSMGNCFDFNRSCWVPRLRSNPNDWEVDEIIRLLKLLGSLNPRFE